MPIDWQLALFGASITLLLAALGFLIKGVGVVVQVLTIVKTLQQELGTHETGLRGSVHQQNKDLLKLDGRVSVLEAEFREKVK